MLYFAFIAENEHYKAGLSANKNARFNQRNAGDDTQLQQPAFNEHKK